MVTSFRASASLFLLAAVTAGCQARSHGASSGSPAQFRGGTIQLQDAGLNMQAGTLSYPAGWQAQGELNRSSPCGAGTPFPVFRLQNQSQQMFILHMLPFFTYSNAGLAGNMQIASCGTVSQLTHASDILERLIAPKLTHTLEGAQVGRPDAVPGVQPSQGNSGGFRTTSDAARVHVAYSEGGQPREEWIVAITSVTYFPGSGGVATTNVAIISAPDGHLDGAVEVANTGIKMQVNPQWQQANAQQDAQQSAMITANGRRTQAGIAAQGQQNMQNSVNMSNQTVDNIHRTGQISMQNARRTQDAIDDSAKQTAAYVGDKVLVYYWRNTVTGATTTTTTRQAPGANWVPQ